MIFRKRNLATIICLLILLFLKPKFFFSQEKFEGIIASVNSEAITTFDLSERIKLVLKSLNLEDNIENRDSVRDRVLELLIIERLKKDEATKASLDYTEEELIDFASQMYKFPKKKFDDFKKYIVDADIDIDVVLAQLSTELLWKKFSHQKFSSIITINKLEVENLLKSYNKKKYGNQFNFSEILIANTNSADWSKSKKRMKKIISLLDSGVSFSTLASKFSDSATAENDGNLGWVSEHSLKDDIKIIIQQMEVGEVVGNIKTNNGFKILKLIDKKKTGEVENLKVTFLKISSFNKEEVERSLDSFTNCQEELGSEEIPDELTISKIENIFLKELSEKFLHAIQNTDAGQKTKIIDIDGEYTSLLICKKDQIKEKKVNRIEIENKIFYEKFHQLSNTYISNLRKNANVKILTKE